MTTTAPFYYTIILGLLTLIAPLYGQDRIEGRVTDPQENLIPFADVRLFKVGDETLPKGQTTDVDGTYSLDRITAGEYIVVISMLGFEEFRSAPFTLGESSGTRDLGTTILKESVIMMEAVEVTGEEPQVTLLADRLVINVNKAITTVGGSALEVLERSPGILVDRQNNGISISGRSGVVVMINGRINYMSSSAVVQLLAGMSADNIEKIEIYTTPPAKFDAEGNAGYINIILKKSLDDGLSGAYTLSAGYGRGETANGSINFNYRQGKFNLYGDYAYLRDAREQTFSFYRSAVLGTDFLETTTSSLRDPVQRNHNGRVGIDLQLSKKTVVGVLFSTYDTKWLMDATNRAEFYTNGQTENLLDIRTVERNQWQHYGANVNLQHTFRDGETLNFDADLLYYRDNNPAEYFNDYLDQNGNIELEERTRSTKVTPIRIGVAKLDYGRPLGEKIKMTTGLKGTLSNFTNDVGVDHLIASNWQADDDLSARYELQEKILAAYGDLDFKLDDKTSAKVGLRFEYTDSNLGSVENPNIVDRQYGRFFPSIFLSRSLHKNHTVNLSYSRRITRPTFNQMAPFVIFMDPTTFFSGNPALQPAFSNNFKLDYRFKSALISLQYSREDSTIASFQSRIIPGTNDQLIYAQNLQGSNTASITFSLPYSPAPWWNMFFNASGTWQKAGVYYDDVLAPVEIKSVNIFSSQSFTLPKKFTLELSGFYNSGSLFGAFVTRAFGSVNAALQKKFNNDSALSIGVDNIFNTMYWRMSSEVAELQQKFDSEIRFSRRTVKVGFTANFGDGKMKAQRKRATGSEEERNRIGN